MSKFLYLVIFLNALLFMPKADAANIGNIESVHISEMCQTKYPCVHEVNILFEDGSEEKLCLDGITIQALIEFINDSNKITGASVEHFLEYAQASS